MAARKGAAKTQRKTIKKRRAAKKAVRKARAKNKTQSRGGMPECFKLLKGVTDPRIKNCPLTHANSKLKKIRSLRKKAQKQTRRIQRRKSMAVLKELVKRCDQLSKKQHLKILNRFQMDRRAMNKIRKATDKSSGTSKEKPSECSSIKFLLQFARRVGNGEEVPFDVGLEFLPIIQKLQATAEKNIKPTKPVVEERNAFSEMMKSSQKPKAETKPSSPVRPKLFLPHLRSPTLEASFVLGTPTASSKLSFSRPNSSPPRPKKMKLTLQPHKKPTKSPWKKTEVMALQTGVQLFKNQCPELRNKWAWIKSNPKCSAALSDRTTVQLKDKFRTIMAGK